MTFKSGEFSFTKILPSTFVKSLSSDTLYFLLLDDLSRYILLPILSKLLSN